MLCIKSTLIACILYVYGMLEHPYFVNIYIFMSYWCFSISTFKPAIFRALFVSFSGFGYFGMAFSSCPTRDVFFFSFLNHIIHISFMNDRENRGDCPNSGYLTIFFLQSSILFSLCTVYKYFSFTWLKNLKLMPS